MKKIGGLLSVLVAFFLFSSCEVEQGVDFEKAQDVAVVKFNRRKLKIEGNLIFKNNSTLDATISNIGLDILLEGKKVDNIQLDRTHTIAAGSIEKIPFTVKLKSKEIIPIVYQVTYNDFDKKEIQFGLSGKATGKEGEKLVEISIAHNQLLKLNTSEDDEQDAEENNQKSDTVVNSKD